MILECFNAAPVRGNGTSTTRRRSLGRDRAYGTKCKGGFTVNVGDVVTVKVTGQRARIVEERGGYFSIEYLPDAIGDPMDRDQTRSSEAAGMYREEDLDLAE
jgi:hypothetical protein